MKDKIRFHKTLSFIILPIIVFAFTVLLHHVSIETVGHHLFDSILTVQFSDDLPSAIAQDESPLSTPSPTLNPTESPTDKDSLKVDLRSNDQPINISENGILSLLMVVLVGVLILLWLLMSPVVGFQIGPVGKWTDEPLEKKASFLSEAFPKLLEGVTVILIVMVVTVLTLAGFVKEQGTISILSALIGYVLGRKASELEYKQPPGRGRDDGGTEDSDPANPTNPN